MRAIRILVMRFGQCCNVTEDDCDFKQAYYPQDGYITEKDGTWFVRLGESEELGF